MPAARMGLRRERFAIGRPYLDWQTPLTQPSSGRQWSTQRPDPSQTSQLRALHAETQSPLALHCWQRIGSHGKQSDGPPGTHCAHDPQSARTEQVCRQDWPSQCCPSGQALTQTSPAHFSQAAQGPRWMHSCKHRPFSHTHPEPKALHGTQPPPSGELPVTHS